jgi:hypothetical protein
MTLVQRLPLTTDLPASDCLIVRVFFRGAGAVFSFFGFFSS